MIDEKSRLRYRQETNSKNLEQGMKAIAEGMGKTPELVFKLQDEGTATQLGKLGALMELVYKVIPRTITLPRIFQVEGKVEVTKNPPVEVKNLKDLERYFNDLSTQIKMLAHAISSVPQQKIEFPKINIPQPQEVNLEPLRQAIVDLKVQKAPKIEFPKIDIPKPQEIDLSPIVEAVQNLQEALNKGAIDKDALPILRKIETAISQLANRPIMTPQPVTNVNINALQGFSKTTNATVGTTAVSLPSYGQLFNRRSLIIYNNSANTIFIGGSDVTTSNGLPIATSTFSPSIDAGYNMKVYAIAASGGNDVRVLEISKDQTANIQQ